MADLLDDGPRRAPTWEVLQQSIHGWLVARFGLNRPLDKDIWLFCIGAAMHLERMAVGVLWVDDGRAEPLYEYEAKMTLGQAQQEIKKRGLLDETTRTTLKDVADLRNSVAHRHATHVRVSRQPLLQANNLGTAKPPRHTRRPTFRSSPT